MNTVEELIHRCTFSRISELFDVPVSQLRNDLVFGKDLDVSFVSDFRHNEFDKVLFDLEDVSDEYTLKELDEDLLQTFTIEDYFNHMIRCFETHPVEVAMVLDKKKESQLWELAKVREAEIKKLQGDSFFASMLIKLRKIFR